MSRPNGPSPHQGLSRRGVAGEWKGYRSSRWESVGVIYRVVADSAVSSQSITAHDYRRALKTSAPKKRRPGVRESVLVLRENSGSEPRTKRRGIRRFPEATISAIETTVFAWVSGVPRCWRALKCHQVWWSSRGGHARAAYGALERTVSQRGRAVRRLQFVRAGAQWRSLYGRSARR
jgi:hypothetical protein